LREGVLVFETTNYDYWKEGILGT